MSDLARFQDAFALALSGDSSHLTPWLADPAAPGLAVYRNTVTKARLEALADNHPALLHAIGASAFMTAALGFDPPTSPCLIAYGPGFEESLEAAWMRDLVRLDRLWLDSHLAADGPALSAAGMAVEFERLAHARAPLHPAARIAWFAEGSVDLWLACRRGDEGELTLDDRPQGVLITRPGGAVESRVLGPGGYAFLAACGRGDTLIAASAAADAAEPQIALSALFATLITAAALGPLENLDDSID